METNLVPYRGSVKPSTKLAWTTGGILVALGILGTTVTLRALGPASGPAADGGVQPGAPSPVPDTPPELEAHAAPAAEAVRQEVAPVTAEGALEPTEEDEPHRTLIVAQAVDPGARPLARVVLILPSGLGQLRSDPSGPDGKLELEIPENRLLTWRNESLPLTLRAEGPDCATRFFAAAPTPGESTDLGHLTLEPGGGLAGTVVDEQGRPVPEARVIATGVALGGAPEAVRLRGPVTGLGLPETITDRAGRYALSGVPIGDARVWAQAGARPWAFSEPVPVSAGVESPVGDLVLAAPGPGERIAGTVVDPGGGPVPGATVSYGCFADRENRSGRVTADREGRFELVALGAKPHFVLAQDPEGRFRPTYEARVRRGREDVRLVLGLRLWTTVTALDDATGEPIPEPSAYAHDQKDLSWQVDVQPPEVERLGPGVLRLYRPQASFVLQVGAEGYESQRLGPYEPLSAPAELTVRLRTSPKVRGRVLADGQPVAGARVQLCMWWAGADFALARGDFQLRLFPVGNSHVETDEEGRFEHIVRRDSPMIAVIAKADGWALGETDFLELDADGGLDGVEVHLVRGGAIEGEVLAPPEREPRGQLVAISRGDGEVLRARTDENGFYRFEGLTPGGWQVHHREEKAEVALRVLQGAGPIEWDCQVFDGRTTRHDIDARRGTVEVAGRLTIDGVGAAGWSATLSPLEQGHSGTSPVPVLLDAGGGFRLQAPPGSWELAIELPRGAGPRTVVKRELELLDRPVAAPLELVTGMVEGTFHRGVPLDFRWRGHEGVQVDVTLTTGLDGSFAASVPAGEVEVLRELTSGGFAHWSLLRTIQVPAGGRVPVSFDD